MYTTEFSFLRCSNCNPDMRTEEQFLKEVFQYDLEVLFKYHPDQAKKLLTGIIQLIHYKGMGMHRKPYFQGWAARHGKYLIRTSPYPSPLKVEENTFVRPDIFDIWLPWAVDEILMHQGITWIPLT